MLLCIIFIRVRRRINMYGINLHKRGASILVCIISLVPIRWFVVVAQCPTIHIEKCYDTG